MKRRRRSSEIAELVTEYRLSGQTHREFAEAKGVPVSTVSGWLRRSRAGAQESAVTGTSALVPVVSSPTPAHSSVIRIDLPCGRRVEVPADIRRDVLADILAAASERRC